jgi:hypothetical protein
MKARYFKLRFRTDSAHIVICDEAAFMPEEVILQVIFPRLSTRERALFGVELVNNTYIIRYHISTIDMSENRRIVHVYNKKTVN